MQIKRDYSQPFFSQRRPRRSPTRLLFFVGVVIGFLLIYVSTNFQALQERALDAVGMGATPTPLPGNLATQAANLVLLGEYQAAAALFEQALQQRPDNVDFLYEYGLLLIEMGETDRAIEVGDRIQSLNPNDPAGYVLKARALVWGGSPTTAIPIVLAGLDLRQGYDSALYAVLARAYSNSGRYMDGVEAGLRAVEFDPGNIDARRSYAYALSWINATDEATGQLEAALALDPNHIPTYFELALQYLARDRDQEAIDLYDRILAVQPNNARAMLRLCETYRKVGQFDRAIGYCEDSVNADPTSTRALYQLGILHYNRLNFGEGLEYFRRCAEIAPDNLDCMYRLGLSYYYVDDCDRSWEILQNSLRMTRNRFNVETAVENIRAGLIAVGQKCPQYSGSLPALEAEFDEQIEEAPEEFEAQPEVTPES
jgi:tetratricopeptide (TPR) repeat protein